MTTRRVEIAGRTLTLTNLDRPLWPGGYTKGQMLAYYEAVAPLLVPHLADRPLTLRRFPAGVEGTNWYQTNCRGQPDWMRTAVVPGRRGAEFRMCVVDDVASLAWVVNLGSIELHPFLTTAGDLRRPTAVVFDLDPEPPAGLAAACRVALRLRRRLDDVGLEAFAKTSGALGVHVYVPIEPRYGDDETKAFARSVAEHLAGESPELVVARASRRTGRTGKVLVDWLQNDAMRSTVAPYSLRAMPWPLVSTPIRWDELERAAATRDAGSLVFTARAALARAERHGDLFAAVLERRQLLP